ncbi:cardiolipin synthase [Candidatus Mycoplasma haematobovis]|uniref:Cardiolipin synthase n=1 Tax=Candidatus Mycoplasma haematobovis TaxID=432608 RepID=A0A1A9QE95_9MOLU|nr:phosphatidylserine/phosphatidylglycerophosphate/cardiolipin synthase family protein [Candidatus Mycoplasma haematobovis]OAL10285.1 cardiolipin synthase [Candidatus Mycoplasma haematobovis]
MDLSFSKWRSLTRIVGITITTTILIFAIVGIASSESSKFIWALVFNYLVSVVLSLRIINSHRRSDLFVVLYLFSFLLVPFISPFVYFLLGFDSVHIQNNPKYLKILQKYKNYSRYIENKKIKNLSHLSHKVFFYNLIKHDANICGNSKITLLSTPIEILQEITSLIKKAKQFIHLEFYIFGDGLVSDHILDLLRKKTEEGVEVRLMVDYHGSFRRLSSKTRKKIKKYGIELRIFNHFFRFDSLWWQYRNHNKIIVVDNKYAFCGSSNIADEYFNITQFYFQTTELGVIVEGTVVNSINALFCSHWEMCCIKPVKGDPLMLDGLNYFRESNISENTNTVIQVLNASPLSPELIIKDNLVQLVSNAKKSILISTPYFYPPKDLINALKQASVSGVSIKILVPKQTDFRNFFRSLNRQLFTSLIPENIEIYEYFGFNHEKIMIVDDETTYFGSYNWDYRALYLNFENALLVKCKKFTSLITKFVENQFKNSHKIVLSDLKKMKSFVAFSHGVFIRIFKPFL